MAVHFSISMRVVVFGASGVQGAAQVVALIKSGHHPVAVSRKSNPYAINGQQIETFAADFSDLGAVQKSLQNAEAIFLNLPSLSFQPAEPIIEAARTIGEAAKQTPSIRLIVFNTSMPVSDQSTGIEAQDRRRRIRDMLRHMGLPVISIQPGVFLDNLLEGWAWPPIRDHNIVRYCHYPGNEVSWIGLDDLASLMVAALQRPELAGRNFAVGGPETVRLPELAGKLSKAWNRPLTHEFQSIDNFAYKLGEAMKGRATLDHDLLTAQVVRAYTWYNETNAFKIDMEPVLKELPAELTSIEEWARRHNLFV